MRLFHDSNLYQNPVFSAGGMVIHAGHEHAPNKDTKALGSRRVSEGLKTPSTSRQVVVE